jgi:hypothetical protein
MPTPNNPDINTKVIAYYFCRMFLKSSSSNMFSKKSSLVLFLIMVVSTGWKISPEDWIVEKHISYNLFYKTADAQNKDDYASLINNGINTVKAFFIDTFKYKFDVYIHPDRQSLDGQWQKDWKMPDFKSECWMVASGVADKLDMISPKTWDKASCEHSWSDKVKTQQLITHELVHVYHGQLNASKDFSDVENIDWFVEGLAVYASGQCDSVRMADVRKTVLTNQYPSTLDDFWKGNAKYGLSGSMVMFIDYKFGRNKVKGLLKFSKKTQILASLNISEKDLLTGWKGFVLK